VEQGSVGGIEIFRSAPVSIGAVGVPPPDKAEDLVVVDDREDDTVTEPVNETACWRRSPPRQRRLAELTADEVDRWLIGESVGG
jgi:hypothetical protein